MRIATAMGLLFTVVAGFIALPEVIALQATGEGLTGDISVFFSRTTVIVLFLFGAIAIGTVAVVVSRLLNSR